MTLTHDRDQADWGSSKLYPDGSLTPFTIDKIVIHWGGNTDPDGDDNLPSEAEEAAILRSWQAYHIGSKGWTDIAYNTAIGNTGLKYRCRGYNRSGATSGDFDNDGIPENSEAYALVWIGGTAGRPSLEAYRAMGEAIRELMALYGPLEVTVHSDHKATACPGDDWRAWRDAKGWEADAVPMYRGVANVPEWGKAVVDWGIASGIIIVDDNHPDDFTNTSYTDGRLWTFLHRLERNQQ